MFKKILPFIFAAAAHAAPAEAVYVGEPTKKLAQQAARCAGVMAVAGARLGDVRLLEEAQIFFLKFAIEMIGVDKAVSLAQQQGAFYNGTSSGPIDNKRLQADLGVCTKSTITDIAKNKSAQDLASCAATADVAKLENLAIGGDHTKISVNLLEEASIHLGDDRHAVDILVKEFRTLTQAGPSATRAAILNCQPVFNAAIEGIRTNPTGGPAVSPTGPR